jgi:hypothetical protein
MTANASTNDTDAWQEEETRCFIAMYLLWLFARFTHPSATTAAVLSNDDLPSDFGSIAWLEDQVPHAATTYRATLPSHLHPATPNPKAATFPSLSQRQLETVFPLKDVTRAVHQLVLDQKILQDLEAELALALKKQEELSSELRYVAGYASVKDRSSADALLFHQRPKRLLRNGCPDIFSALSQNRPGMSNLYVHLLLDGTAYSRPFSLISR